MTTERLHKLLARAGVASRREAEKMIAEGRVKVDGKVVSELGVQLDPSEAKVTVDGHRVQLSTMDEQEKVYFLLHKPPGVVTTSKDEKGRHTVLDIVKGATESRIYPVGRLDYDAQGALLLTNDGDLAHKLTHPKFHAPKIYLVKVKGTPTEAELNKLRKGIYLEDGPTGPSHIEVVGKARVNTWVEVILTQGKNRQIKRMFWRIEHPVMRIVRTHFAGLSIDGLREGQYRLLTKRELAKLFDLVAEKS